MSTITRVAGLFVFFALAACDADNSASKSIEVAKESNKVASSNNVVYFPDGGGIEFAKPFVEEKESPNVRHKVFIVDNDQEWLSSSITETMESQGYELQGSIDLQGFEQAMSFAKPGSVKRVNYRMRKVNSAPGERIMLRLSWALK